MEKLTSSLYRVKRPLLSRPVDTNVLRLAKAVIRAKVVTLAAVCFFVSKTDLATAATTPIAESIAIGESVSGSLKYGRRVITLPQGEWRLIYKNQRNASTDGQGPVILQLNFDQIRDGRLNRLLEVTATTTSKTINWIDEPCKTKGDSFSIDDRKRSLNDQFCVRVGFNGAMVDGARGAGFQDWARGIVTKGIGYSPEMPFVSVVRYTPYDFLLMRINFDPFVAGIPKSKRPERALNDWQPQIVEADPVRLRFYQALAKWSSTFAAAVFRAAEGDVKLTPNDFGEPLQEAMPISTVSPLGETAITPAATTSADNAVSAAAVAEKNRVATQKLIADAEEAARVATARQVAELKRKGELASSANASAGQPGRLSLDASKIKCTELGFKPATEGYGKCVLQLSK